MDFVSVSADLIKKIVPAIAAVKSGRAIKLRNPSTGFDIRNREIPGP